MVQLIHQGVLTCLAKAARMHGAQIFEKSPVDEILIKDGKISGVKTLMVKN